MANIVETINSDQSSRSELDEILLEADKHKEGHGGIMQDIWDNDSIKVNDEMFNFDQTRNKIFGLTMASDHFSSLVVLMIISVQRKQHICYSFYGGIFLRCY